MKINMLLSGCLLGLLCFTACDSEGNEMNDYTHYVNSFIGTGGHGHTHPGAMVPHGMIQPGPDTRIDGWDSCSGYYYEDTTINGFAHTRLSGTGCADFGDFLLMPTVGEQKARSVLSHRLFLMKRNMPNRDIILSSWIHTG